MSTRQLAQLLKISTRKLRRVLRTIPRYNDGIYTRYQLSPATQKRVRSLVSA